MNACFAGLQQLTRTFAIALGLTTVIPKKRKRKGGEKFETNIQESYLG